MTTREQQIWETVESNALIQDLISAVIIIASTGIVAFVCGLVVGYLHFSK